MSYILDALRKLEENRLHGESLTFLAFQGRRPSKPKRRRLWLYLLIAALILNAGVIFWWIGLRQPPGTGIPARTQAVPGAQPAISAPGPAAAAGENQTNTEKKALAPRDVNEPQTAAVREMEAVRSSESPITEPAPIRKKTPNSDLASTPKQAPAPRQAPAAEPKPAPPPAPIVEPAPPPRQTPITELAPSSGQTAAAPKTPVTEPAPAVSEKPSVKPPVRAEVTPPANGKVLTLADLPPSVTGDLPAFKISLLYYIAEPQSRFVMINNRTLREGESLSEGLKVEQINQGNVVMNYKGWRFQIELSGSK